MFDRMTVAAANNMKTEAIPLIATPIVLFSFTITAQKVQNQILIVSVPCPAALMLSN